jgi:hypothetical protein
MRLIDPGFTSIQRSVRTQLRYILRQRVLIQVSNTAPPGDGDAIAVSFDASRLSHRRYFPGRLATLGQKRAWLEPSLCSTGLGTPSVLRPSLRHHARVPLCAGSGSASRRASIRLLGRPHGSDYCLGTGTRRLWPHTGQATA